MKDFYQDILSRNSEDPSPLEKVILLECAEAEEYDRLHERRIRQMLEDIRRRTREAADFGGRDWVVATFEGLLARASSELGERITEEELRQLPPAELRIRRTAQRNRPAARAYECRKQGLPCQDRKAERQLLRLYESIVGRLESNAGKDISHGQTLQRLMDNPCRVFCRKLTGLHQYRYYCKDQLLATATVQILPGFPMVIRCCDQTFRSTFDADVTGIPSTGRDITDENEPAGKVARLTWKDWDMYELTIREKAGPMTVQIRKEEDRFCFYAENRCIAELASLPEKQQLLDWELAVSMKFHDSLPLRTQVLLMSFPMLQIVP